MGEELEDRLKEALAECQKLRGENTKLKALLSLPVENSILTPDTTLPLNPHVTVNNSSPVSDKIRLFRDLFRGRGDVYALRWEGKNGKKGYAPACIHDWNCPVCIHDRKKRSQCENRKFLPVTDLALHDHLSGKITMGVYPLLTDETGYFLAADFDKQSWMEDAAAFLKTCRSFGVPAALERSRSGQGGHVWIFFEGPLRALLARKMGSALLTFTLEKRHQIGMDSYDRFFPNQDTLPKGGFGNLIALPLQKIPRDSGNSVFLDENFHFHADQWDFLSNLKKMQGIEVDKLVNEAARIGKIIDVPLSLTEEDETEPWNVPSRQKRNERIMGPFPAKADIVISNKVYIGKAGLPPAMLNKLLRLAAFQNPEFYKAQAMRLSTFGKPRIISCGEDLPRHIALPRGCLDEAMEFLEEYKIKVEIKDERCKGVPVDIDFHGELRPAQKEAARTMQRFDTGILSATTAFGKTVVAAWLIAARKVNTLILVHRRQLMDQWQERLSLFLNLDKKEIGLIGGGKKKPTGKIDIAILQSLGRKGAVDDLVAGYGQVVVDECHHISAFSFEQVLKGAKAKYVLGLTATPFRKDGHQPIIMMQCGPIRHRQHAKQEAQIRPFEHHVIPRETHFNLPLGFNSGIQEIYKSLTEDEKRNDLIFDDLINTLEQGRSPLFLTERTEHVDSFAERLRKFAKNVIVLKGGMGRKQRLEVIDQIKSIPEGEERVLLATGRYIGEGFDDARLDTLFLALPISWHGTLQQYVGRLHRLYDQKKVVQVYDYADLQVPMLRRMYEKRLKGYRAIGYSVVEAG